MRVLTIIDSFIVGGAERSLAMVTPYLVERGVDMHVAYLRYRPGVEEELRGGGASIYSLVGDERWLPSIRRTTDLIRSVRPDLVHTTLFKSDIIGRTAARLSGVPVISSIVTESYGPEHVGNPEYKAWRVRASQLADALTARFVTRFHSVSEAAADVMATRLWLRRSKMDVIPRGRDPRHLGTRSPERRVRVRADLGIDDSTKLVLAAARHFHMKGLDVLVKAFPKVLATHPEAHLFVAGRSGPATPELEMLIQDSGIGGAVTLAGYRADVPDLMCAADAFVLPSRAEGSPGALIEAMALEVPTVATDLTSVRELLGDQPEIMALCPVDAEDDMGGAIADVLADPEHWHDMTTKGRERFLERYSIEAIADAMVDLYRRSLGEDGSPGIAT